MTDAYESLRLRNQLCFPLYLCSKEIVRLYGPMLEQLNLTYTQYIVMMYFWERRRSNAKELSKALLLDPSTLTPILKKLEQKDYLSRMRDPGDERNLVITLTEEGAQLQSAALDIPSRMGCCLGLTDEEAAALGTLIGKVLNNIEKEL